MWSLVWWKGISYWFLSFYSRFYTSPKFCLLFSLSTHFFCETIFYTRYFVLSYSINIVWTLSYFTDIVFTLFKCRSLMIFMMNDWNYLHNFSKWYNQERVGTSNAPWPALISIQERRRTLFLGILRWNGQMTLKVKVSNPYFQYQPKVSQHACLVQI